VSGTPPSVTYKPATNYFGSDAFTFKVNNGITDSSPATVSLTVTQVYYPPIAFSQSLTNFEDTALPVTLTGYDPQGYGWIQLRSATSLKSLPSRHFRSDASPIFLWRMGLHRNRNVLFSVNCC
jgi:hypothetical protein